MPPNIINCDLKPVPRSEEAEGYVRWNGKEKISRRGFLSLQLAARSEVAELVGHQANKRKRVVSVLNS